MNSRNGTVIVITGASAGVGRAVAREFAKKGNRLALLARGVERLKSAQKEMESLGGQAAIFPVDVADASAIEQTATAIENQLGPIHIWINNAITTVFSSFMEIEPDEYRRVTEVCYLGFVYGTHAALKRMIPRNAGTIVQVGSALAYRGIPLQSAYCGAKHAIQGFTESLRSELIRQNSRIHITMVQLPALNTPQFDWCKTNFDCKPQPVPPIYQPEVAARAIYWAAYHHRRELSVGLNTTVILWLNKFFPGFGDRYLARTGYDSQMTDDKVSPDRPENLWQPVEGDYSAHGRFDKMAKRTSWHLWANTHLPITISGGLILIILILVLIFKIF